MFARKKKEKLRAQIDWCSFSENNWFDLDFNKDQDA